MSACGRDPPWAALLEDEVNVRWPWTAHLHVGYVCDIVAVNVDSKGRGANRSLLEHFAVAAAAAATLGTDMMLSDCDPRQLSCILNLDTTKDGGDQPRYPSPFTFELWGSFRFACEQSKPASERSS